jgi:hypothetical protein
MRVKIHAASCPFETHDELPLDRLRVADYTAKTVSPLKSPNLKFISGEILHFSYLNLLHVTVLMKSNVHKTAC